MLVVICGLPGLSKTTLGKALAVRCSAIFGGQESDSLQTPRQIRMVRHPSEGVRQPTQT